MWKSGRIQEEEVHSHKGDKQIVAHLQPYQYRWWDRLENLERVERRIPHQWGLHESSNKRGIPLLGPTIKEEWKERLYRQEGDIIIFELLQHEVKYKIQGVCKILHGLFDHIPASRAYVRDDPRRCHFAKYDFRTFPKAWKQEATGTPLYEPFFGAFKIYWSFVFLEPNIWLWMVK